MHPFRVCLIPSKRLLAATALLHLSAAAVCIRYFDGLSLGIGTTVIFTSAWYAWRIQTLRGRQAVAAITFDTRGRAELLFRQPEISCRAVLRSDSLIHRFGCILAWDTPNGIVRHTVLPDMTDSESYRRLLVWLRFSGMMVARLAEKHSGDASES